MFWCQNQKKDFPFLRPLAIPGSPVSPQHLIFRGRDQQADCEARTGPLPEALKPIFLLKKPRKNWKEKLEAIQEHPYEAFPAQQRPFL